MSLGKDSQVHERAIRQRIDGVDVAPVQTQVADTRVHPRPGIFFQKLRRGDEGIAWRTPLGLFHDFAPRESRRVFYPQLMAVAPSKKLLATACRHLGTGLRIFVKRIPRATTQKKRPQAKLHEQIGYPL